jgi:hypothetical protein
MHDVGMQNYQLMPVVRIQKNLETIDRGFLLDLVNVGK